MKIQVKRIAKKDTYTIGKMFIDGVYFCDTIEDRCINWDIDSKINGKTAIKEGTYKVVLTVSNRFKRLLPLLINVPNFDGIRIHSGNTEHDTEGCILVGENKQKGMVLNSRVYEKKLMLILKKASEITIEIS